MQKQITKNWRSNFNSKFSSAERMSSKNIFLKKEKGGGFTHATLDKQWNDDARLFYKERRNRKCRMNFFRFKFCFRIEFQVFWNCELGDV